VQTHNLRLKNINIYKNYIFLLRVSCIDIRVAVEFTVSTVMEELEEKLYCSWGAGIVGNVQWVCLWLEHAGN